MGTDYIVSTSPSQVRDAKGDRKGTEYSFSTSPFRPGPDGTPSRSLERSTIVGAETAELEKLETVPLAHLMIAKGWNVELEKLESVPFGRSR